MSEGQKEKTVTAGVTRRDVLRTLAVGAVGGSVLQVIPAKAAEDAHRADRMRARRTGSHLVELVQSRHHGALLLLDYIQSRRKLRLRPGRTYRSISMHISGRR